MRPQPLIAVTDVEASSRWYQRLLGCQSAHGGAEYERLVANGTLILQLHRFDVEHHHGRIGDPNDKPYGNGVLLWFETDDFDAAMERAAAMGAEIVMPRHRNPPEGRGGPNHWECWLRDPDGYTVVLASPDGSAGYRALISFVILGRAQRDPRIHSATPKQVDGSAAWVAGSNPIGANLDWRGFVFVAAARRAC